MENDVRFLLFNNSLQKNDNNINSYTSQAKKHIYEGNSKLEFSNIGGALDEYSKAISVNPDYDLAYIYRGNVYFALDLFNNAKLDYIKAIELNPDNTTAEKMLKLINSKKCFHNGSFKDVKQDVSNESLCLYILILNMNLIPNLEQESNFNNNPKPTTTLIYDKFAANYMITPKSLKTDVDGIYKYANRSSI